MYIYIILHPSDKNLHHTRYMYMQQNHSLTQCCCTLRGPKDYAYHIILQSAFYCMHFKKETQKGKPKHRYTMHTMLDVEGESLCDKTNSPFFSRMLSKHRSTH